MSLDMDKPCQVYVLRAADGEVLYVGQSCDVTRRLGDHRRGWSRVPWRLVAAVDIEAPLPRRDALIAERRRIIELAPVFNLRDHPDYRAGTRRALTIQGITPVTA